MSISPDSLSEDGGATDVTITVDLRDGATRDEDTIVTLTLSGSAGESDYTASTLESITIPAGQSSASGELTVTPVDDSVIEKRETILLTGSAPGLGETSGAMGLTDPVNADGEAASARLSIASPSIEVSEGSNAEFTVDLSHSVAANVTVDWSVTPSTADAADYATGSGSVTFAASSPAGATRTVAIPISQDLLSEGAESLEVTLGTVSGDLASQASLKSGESSATGTIAESDSITVNITGPSSVDEGETTTAYTLSLSPSGVIPTADLTVKYATTNGSAEAGKDYIAKSGTLTFTVQTRDDSLEGGTGESFTVTLSNPQRRGRAQGGTGLRLGDHHHQRR